MGHYASEMEEHPCNCGRKNCRCVRLRVQPTSWVVDDNFKVMTSEEFLRTNVRNGFFKLMSMPQIKSEADAKTYAISTLRAAMNSHRKDLLNMERVHAELMREDE